MNQALVLVDIQNDYFPGGKMQLVGMEAAAENASRILEISRRKNIPLFHIQHIAVQPGAIFFLPDTDGAAIHHSVTPANDEPVIRKHYPSCFRETPLLNQLEEMEIKELIFCGAMSHMCIDTTVRAAFDLGFQCTVISDACATRDLEFEGVTVDAAKVHATIMAALSRPFARLIKTSEFEDILS